MKVLDMNKVFRSSISFLLACILLLSLASCNENHEGYSLDEDGYFLPTSPVALAIVIGRHANAMAVPDDAYLFIEQELNRAVYGGYVCVIISDGYPSKVENFVESDFFEADRRGVAALKREIENRVKEISNKLRDERIVAEQPENDLLAAIREAKNALSAPHVRDIEDKRIIIIDTGISTEGELSFVGTDYPNEGRPNIAQTVKNLKERDILPDLSGIDVTFVGTDSGLAEVAAPQALSVEDERYIKELWGSIVEGSHADSVSYESVAGWQIPNLYTEDEQSIFPSVKPVIFSKEGAEISIWGDNPVDSDLPPGPDFEIELPSTMVGFAPDEAVFKDDRQARLIISECADDIYKYLNTYSGEKVWVVGTTAAVSIDGSGDVSLGRARAEKVTSILINEYGIDSNRLITIGVGAKFPWHINEFSKGAFDTNIAQGNRSVWLISTSEENDKYNALIEAYRAGELLNEAMEDISRFMIYD